MRVEGRGALPRREVGGSRVERSPGPSRPDAGLEALRDHLAFYPGRVDAAWLDDERVAAQEGDFYGGWITADLVGPFKGAPGHDRLVRPEPLAFM